MIFTNTFIFLMLNIFVISCSNLPEGFEFRFEQDNFKQTSSIVPLNRINEESTRYYAFSDDCVNEKNVFFALIQEDLTYIYCFTNITSNIYYISEVFKIELGFLNIINSTRNLADILVEFILSKSENQQFLIYYKLYSNTTRKVSDSFLLSIENSLSGVLKDKFMFLACDKFHQEEIPFKYELSACFKALCKKICNQEELKHPNSINKSQCNSENAFLEFLNNIFNNKYFSNVEESNFTSKKQLYAIISPIIEKAFSKWYTKLSTSSATENSNYDNLFFELSVTLDSIFKTFSSTADEVYENDECCENYLIVSFEHNLKGSPSNSYIHPLLIAPEDSYVDINEIPTY